MAQLTRFGRRLALPSTRQIIHEMRVLEAGELARKQAADEPANKTTVADPVPPAVSAAVFR